MAEKETCRSRAEARGLDRAEFEARAASQLSPEQKAKRADIIIDNNGDPAELEAQAEGLMQALASRS